MHVNGCVCKRICVFRDIPQEEESGAAQGDRRDNGLIVCLHGSLVGAEAGGVYVFVCMCKPRQRGGGMKCFLTLMLLLDVNVVGC